MMIHRTSLNADDILLKNHHQNQIMSEEDHQEQSIIIINSSCPISWKLYDNPFFAPTNTSNLSIISSNHNNNNPLKLKPKQLQRRYSATAKFLHSSDLKMNSNVSTTTTNNNNVVSSSSENASSEVRTQVAELKAELEMERKQRKKMEALNKKLSRELIDQVEKEKMCICDDLSKEVSRLKEEMERMKKEMEEERKMLRMAEVLREERVQMKLSDAHLFYHHHFRDHVLSQHQQKKIQTTSSVEDEESKKLLALSSDNNNNKCLLNHGTTIVSSSFNGSGRNVNVQRKASPEAENPHIKQGIKGFVEFQRAIKAKNGCNYGSNNYNGGIKQSRDVGIYNKLECQKAQLRVLFKNKYPLPYSNHDHLILS